MTEIVITWWTGLMMASAVIMFAIAGVRKLHEWGIYPLREMPRFVRRPWFERLLLLFVICGMVQYGATKGTGGGSRSADDDARKNVPECVSQTQDPSRDGIPEQSGEITNLCFTGIYVLTNGVVFDVAWPTHMFVDGTTLDFFAKYHALTNDWRWVVARPTRPAETNLSLFADMLVDLGEQISPAAMFFKVQDRNSCAGTMADSDGDGLPDVYELHNGTNPYVSDYANAPKLTVGPQASYATFGAALAASTNYSIIALPSQPESSSEMIVMPSHPVMVTGPANGYAMLHSSASIAAVLMDAGQGSETLFRNLYVVLESKDGFQSAFWIGGNLPWSGIGASPTFENVRVRALYPNVLHYGWHYYRDYGGFSSLSNCVMNAAGSTSAIGVYAYDGPEVSVSDCAFVNFPTNVGSCATWIRSETNVVAEVASACTNLSWAGYPLDANYSDTTDSDGDGLSDYEEIHLYDTDPWLADSDGDGLSDAEEVELETDPCDLYSFFRRVTVVTTTSDSLSEVTNYVAWGTSGSSWETNDLVACVELPSTNAFRVSSSTGPMYVKAYRDLNRNGQYDADEDILLVKQIPPMEAVSFFSFSFGDVDGDGVADDVERLHGSNPYDKASMCFNMVLSVEDVPRTTNSLTAKVSLESVVVWGPIVVTGNVLSANLGHLIATNGGAVAVAFWDDANGNSLLDTNEWTSLMSVAPTGHENIIVKQFDKRNFDSDNDGTPDWWETLHTAAGLSPANAADALLDADADGLINYHEYWTGCNPAVPDGSNTLISVCSRSVDDRIRGIVPSNAVNRFIHFFENAPSGIYVPNTNFWLRDVDVSCVSVWNDGSEPGSMTATAITRKHVIMAAHWHATSNYSFVVNGQVVTQHVERTYLLPSSDMLLGRLDANLPETIRLPMVLSTELLDSIANCKYLPGVCINNRKAATVLELDSLNCDVTARGGAVYHQMGMTSSGNVVSPERASIWASTVVGNSSSPVFLLMGEELIFLFSKHLGYKGEGASAATWGPILSYRLTEVQNKIDEWEGDKAHEYQINIINSYDKIGD